LGGVGVCIKAKHKVVSLKQLQVHEMVNLLFGIGSLLLLRREMPEEASFNRAEDGTIVAFFFGESGGFSENFEDWARLVDLSILEKSGITRSGTFDDRFNVGELFQLVKEDAAEEVGVVMLTVTLVAMLDGVDGVGGKLHAV
jgi:hypothetical protein